MPIRKICPIRLVYFHAALAGCHIMMTWSFFEEIAYSCMSRFPTKLLHRLFQQLVLFPTFTSYLYFHTL